MVCSNLFCTAPRLERKEETLLIAASIVLNLTVAPDTEKPLIFNLSADISSKLTVIDWPLLAPIWKLNVFEFPEKFNNFMVLNSVLPAIPLISAISCSTSFWISALSASVFVSLAACKARSLILLNMLCTSFKAPSAVWIREIPSWAFL